MMVRTTNQPGARMQRAIFLCVAFSCCVLRCVVAQQAPQPDADHSPKSQPQNLQLPQPQPIHLDAVVNDKSGNPVPGLTQADFTLFDNGQPSPIESFSALGTDTHEAAPHVEAVLVFDTINVSFQDISVARAAVATFLRQSGAKLPLPISVVWLTSGGWTEVLPPSRDGNFLATQIDPAESRLRTIPVPPNTYDSLNRIRISVKMMEGIASFEAGKSGRKLLIWIGPGWPMMNNSPENFANNYQQEFFADIIALCSELRRARIAVYSVIQGVPVAKTYQYQDFLKGVKRWQSAFPPNMNLRVVAVQSGGRVMTPSNDLVPELEDCLRDAGPFYSLSFTPPRADGPNEYHELKLRVQKPGLIVRTTTGYYNQP
jgi:VWFA-related protein